MNDLKTEMKWTEDKKLYTTVEYPGKPVEISVGGEKFIVGEQPAYSVVNVIDSEKTDTLKAYLLDQYELLEKRKKAAMEVISETSVAEVEGLRDALNKIPTDKLKQKKLLYLNEMAKKALMRNEAEANFKVINKSMLKIKEQIDFILTKP